MKEKRTRIQVVDSNPIKIPEGTTSVKFHVETPSNYSKKAMQHYNRLMLNLLGKNIRLQFAPAIEIKFNRPLENLEVEFIERKQKETSPVGWENWS